MKVLTLFLGTAQGTLAFDSANTVEFDVDALGNLDINASGDVVRAPNSDLQVCEGGACPTSLTNQTVADDGNVVVENDIVLGGRVVSESQAFVATINAGESGGLNNGQYEYSYGNGGTRSANHYGYVAAMDGAILSLAFGCNTPGNGVTEVAVDINFSGLEGHTVSAAANVAKANTVFAIPLTFSAGDTINFKTVSAGSASRCVANSLVEFYP